MGLLNQLFASSVNVAEKAERSEEEISKVWNDYLETIPEKEQIINQLPQMFGQKENPLKRLKQLLISELTSISKDEKEEKKIIEDIKDLEHSKKIARVHKLEISLAYAGTKFKYVYELLRHLYAVLEVELRLADKLLHSRELRKYRKLVEELSSELIVEKTLLNKISEIETFHNLFSSLVKGEQVIQKMNDKEKRFMKKIEQIMNEVFSNQIKEGITYEWAMLVFERIKDKVHELIAEGVYEYHPDVLFEFVNGEKFVELSKETLLEIRKRSVSNELLNAFIHLFREWYNKEMN